MMMIIILIITMIRYESRRVASRRAGLAEDLSRATRPKFPSRFFI